MNLFDFTYCGNYNRQIQNLARISPEKWSFGQSGDNGILKGYLENTFRRLYEEGKVREENRISFPESGSRLFRRAESWTRRIYVRWSLFQCSVFPCYQ